MWSEDWPRFTRVPILCLIPWRSRWTITRGAFTRLRVISEDTPAFLYALSNALSLHDVSIEHVRIRTIHGRVEDEIDLVDLRGRKIEDPELLNRVKFSVLLTKQFTYFLGVAPDPFTALSRFEQIVRDVVQKKKEKEWLDLLTHPHLLKDLARLLGASDFLWEDFIRLQYETLLPMLSPYVGTPALAETPETLAERMAGGTEGRANSRGKGAKAEPVQRPGDLLHRSRPHSSS